MLPGLFFGLLAITAIALPSASAQDPSRYFPETGHYLHPHFEAFFDAHGETSLLGPPITDGYVDPSSYLLIQYFENARLESAIRQRGAPTVRMSPLGEALAGRRSAPRTTVLPLWAAPGCRREGESGFSVCHAFREYYDLHGGAQVLGLPIADYAEEDGRLVQYFQNVRLDWHPENPPQSQIEPAALGRMHFDRSRLDPALLAPRPAPREDSGQVTVLRASLALGKPVAQSSDTQHVQVIVRDQRGFPVTGAAVTLDIALAGERRTMLLPLTDADGVTRAMFSFERQPPGTTIVLEASVLLGQLRAETRDSFSVWW